MAEIPPLPPGFTLDAPQAPAQGAPQAQGAIPPLPEGFTLDQPQAGPGAPQAAPAPPTNEPNMAQREFSAQNLGRQVGLVARAGVMGIAGLPLTAMDAGVAARNLITGENYEHPSSMFAKGLDAIGLPKPETAGEKIASFVESVLVGSRTPAPQAKSPAPTGFKGQPNLDTAVRDATLKQSRAAGYVVPPTTTNPSGLNKALEGAAGKLTTAQLASIKNQKITNQLARHALGLANDTPLTPSSLNGLRTTAGRVYEEVGKTGEIVPDAQYLDELTQLGKGVDEITQSFPKANVGAAKEINELVDSLLQDKFSARASVEYLKELRAQARGNLSPLAAADPAKRALGMAQREAAATLEDMMMRHLAQNGKEDLAVSFDQARRLIAVSHSVENALNPATGNVAASALASQMKRGKPLSGELEVAAQFARAFPKAAKEINESMPGISPLDYYGSVGAAGLFGSPHLLFLPALRLGIRNALLTPMGQKLGTAATETVAGAPAQTLGVPAAAAVQLSPSAPR